MKRFFVWFALLMMLAPGALAARTYVTWADTVKLYSPREQDWTYVTRENFEEHMDMITGHGFDETDARTRFESGETIFEAYHIKELDDGCLRLQVFENEYTREKWSHLSFSTEDRAQFVEDLKLDQTGLPFDFRAPKWDDGKYGGKDTFLSSGFVSKPPYTYESGMMNMQIHNGKAYVYSYVAKHPVSSWNKIPDREENIVREKLKDMRMVSEKQPRGVTLTLEGPDVLQTVRESLIIRGKSQKGADVQAQCEGAQVQCSTQEDGSFTAEITFAQEGQHDVVLTASKKGATDTTVTLPVLVSRSICPLTVNKAPKDVEDAGEKTISGRTLPGAEVRLSTGWEEFECYANDEGYFSQQINMEYDGVYPISIRAIYEGLDTAKIEYVSSVVTDEKTMLRQAKQRLDGVKLRAFVEDPQAHEGKTVSYEARIDEIVYERGGMKIRASTKDANGKRQRYMLETCGYMEDKIYEDMRLTFYGKVKGWGKMETEEGEVSMPCAYVDSAMRLVIVD